MLATYQPGAMKKFRRTPWRFQKTFLTPMGNLDRFAAIIFAALPDVTAGTVTIDATLTEEGPFAALLSTYRLPRSFLRHDGTIMAETPDEVQALLVSALQGAMDFIFIPTPKPFVWYADHDDYITFFANSKSNLNKVALPLLNAGFETVDYIREL